MADDLLGYNEMVERAMRSVVREALSRAGRDGLPGNHHFYITFRTDHPDVEMPDRLREKYPEEMTIVLQHQFWGLKSDEEGFDVELSFNQQQEHLRIPFDSLITFADPSVNFGLQFHVDPEGFPSETGEDRPVASDETGPAPEGAPKPRKRKESANNVVTLDKFRKK